VRPATAERVETIALRSPGLDTGSLALARLDQHVSLVVEP
jgi:hypothetical protein